MSGAHDVKAFPKAPCNREDQADRHVRGVLGNDARRVRDQNPAHPRGLHVDMVDAGTIVGDEFQPVAGLGKKRTVDQVRDRGNQHVSAGDRCGQFRLRHRFVIRPQLHIEQLLHAGFNRFGQFPGHNNGEIGIGHDISHAPATLSW